MTLVIGVGNDLRGDDGAGLAVARELAARAPAGIEVLALDGDPPGTVVRVEAGRDHGGVVADRRRHDSSHAVALGDAVALARVLDRLPPRLTIVGITGAAFELGTGLSAPVRATVDRVVASLIDDVVASLAGEEVTGRVPR